MIENVPSMPSVDKVPILRPGIASSIVKLSIVMVVDIQNLPSLYIYNRCNLYFTILETLIDSSLVSLIPESTLIVSVLVEQYPMSWFDRCSLRHQL